MKNKHICLLLIVCCVFTACKSSNVCPDNPSIGNIGSVLNSGGDDYLPVVYQDKIYFTSIRSNGKANPEVNYSSKIRPNGQFEVPEIENVLPMNFIDNSGSPSFYFDEAKGITELYFAAVAGEGGKLHKDIYVSYNSGRGWTQPEQIRFNIDTKYYESHPSISPDGKFLVFSSDRPGSYGETDLYITRRLEGGKWSNPENLGSKINTPEKEISPMIAKDGTLYFASKGFRAKTGFDILKATPDGKGGFNSPIILPFPINSESDDTGPALLGDRIILSSNRSGGCGGFDIYSFNICGSAFITGEIKTNDQNVKGSCKVELYDAADKILENKVLTVGESYHFDVSANNNYKIVFSNSCTGSPKEYKFFAPCSDTSVIKIVADYFINNENDNYNFEQYDVPFFVSGYYQPNTIENLEALRLKFEYNIFGKADSTRYIEKPGDEYDKYTDRVEQALSSAIAFIKDKIRYLSGDCNSGDEKIKITITGFADPRPVSANSRYADSEIDDKEIGFSVDRGAKMDNNLLSKLRAYFTAAYFKRVLEFDDSYLDMADKVVWEINGSGADENRDRQYQEMRRVNISVSLVK